MAAWRARHIGYIFQTYNLVPVLTAYENVELPLLLLPMSRSERRKRVGVALEAVGLADLADLLGMLRWLGYACIGLVLALVAATTVMTVHDRVGEHSLLQTIGFSSRRVFGLVLAESVLMSLAGGLAGVTTATLLLAGSDLAVGAEAVTIPVRPSLGLAAVGLAMSAGVGVLAGLIPAWQAARADIVASLRE